MKYMIGLMLITLIGTASAGLPIGQFENFNLKKYCDLNNDVKDSIASAQETALICMEKKNGNAEDCVASLNPFYHQLTSNNLVLKENLLEMVSPYRFVFLIRCEAENGIHDVDF